MAPTTHELLGRAGESCAGGQCDNTPASEKIYIAAGSAVCGAIVLTVGGILLYRHIRTRSKAKSARSAAANDSMATPMMSQYAPSTFSFHTPLTTHPTNTYQPPARPPRSSVSQHSPYADSASGSSSSDHSVKSPMSDHSSQFAFPILSADGHLMPPLPASSRKSWNISEGDLGSRPLPLAPGEEIAAYDYENTYEQYEYDYDYVPYETSSDGHSLKAPIPQNPSKRWSYDPTSLDSEVVGLYPSTVALRQDEHDYGYDNASVKSYQRTPKVEDTFGFHQPQAATYHRSFSAEGEELRG